jgi:hypothetical protein
MEGEEEEVTTGQQSHSPQAAAGYTECQKGGHGRAPKVTAGPVM